MFVRHGLRADNCRQPVTPIDWLDRRILNSFGGGKHDNAQAFGFGDRDPVPRTDIGRFLSPCGHLEGSDGGLRAQAVCNGDEADASAGGERPCRRAVSGRADAQDGAGGQQEREGSAKVEPARRQAGPCRRPGSAGQSLLPKEGNESPDVIKAYMWYEVAAAQGNPEAQKEVATITKELSPQQLAEAQAKAQQCKSSNYEKCDGD